VMRALGVGGDEELEQAAEEAEETVQPE